MSVAINTERNRMNILMSPVLANIYYIGGGGLGLVVIIVLVVLLLRR